MVGCRTKEVVFQCCDNEIVKGKNKIVFEIGESSVRREEQMEICTDFDNDGKFWMLISFIRAGYALLNCETICTDEVCFAEKLCMVADGVPKAITEMDVSFNVGNRTVDKEGEKQNVVGKINSVNLIACINRIYGFTDKVKSMEGDSGALVAADRCCRVEDVSLLLADWHAVVIPRSTLETDKKAVPITYKC